MKKGLVIIGVVVIVVQVILCSSLVKTINQAIEWNYYDVKTGAQGFIQEYDETLPVKEKEKAVAEFRDRYFCALESMEIMSKNSMFYRDYYVKGAADFLLFSETDKNEVVGKNYKRLKRYCEKIVDIRP